MVQTHDHSRRLLLWLLRLLRRRLLLLVRLYTLGSNSVCIYIYIYVYIDVMKLFYKADGHSFFCVFTRGVDYEHTLSGDRRIHPLT